MKIKTDRNVQYHLISQPDESDKRRRPIIFLHGMTLSGKDWQSVISRLTPTYWSIAPDLIGHGRTDAPDHGELYQIEAVIEQLVSVMDTLEIETADWVGYSMGGRILFHFARSYPDRVQSMVVESSTAGLEGTERRAQRRCADEELARYIKNHSLEEFVKRWSNAPIFDTQQSVSQSKRERAKEIRLSGDPTGYIHSLRNLGRGVLSPIWDQLDQLDFPICLITGSEDSKHVKIHRRMQETLPRACSIVVEDVGHNVHFERPDQYVRHLKEFWLGARREDRD